MTSIEIKSLIWSDLSESDKRACLKRPPQSLSREVEEKVEFIIKGVRKEGDKALKKFTQKFDGAQVENFQITAQEYSEAQDAVAPVVLSAMEDAVANLEKFHRPQKPKKIEVEIDEGIRCQRLYRPLSRVGLYIPGGSAVLFSTLLMLGVPARLAGCSRRVVVTPPRPDGTIHPLVLVAARLCSIDEVYSVGGAQAIAALAYGTESLPRVDKIFGPGNSFVTAAKLAVARDDQGAAIDLPAGPSEVLVIADDQARPDFVAADLLSQAEHDPLSQVICITTDKEMASRVREELALQIEDLPRKQIALASLSESRIIVVDSVDEAIEISNEYAPEHLILQVERASHHVDKIQNAGSIFLGAYSPEAVGDYASGTNHVLPTSGFARAYGGITVESFMKTITVQELTPQGLEEIGPVVEVLAEAEKLEAHRRAVEIRREKKS